jgi:hypothetical protein
MQTKRKVLWHRVQLFPFQKGEELRLGQKLAQGFQNENQPRFGAVRLADQNAFPIDVLTISP